MFFSADLPTRGEFYLQRADVRDKGLKRMRESTNGISKSVFTTFPISP